LLKFKALLYHAMAQRGVDAHHWRSCAQLQGSMPEEEQDSRAADTVR
jgi:hypothetical protein